MLTRGHNRNPPPPLPGPGSPLPVPPFNVWPGEMFGSPDPGVSELARHLEVEIPGSINGPNVYLFRSDGSTISDVDIATNYDIAIQVNMGNGNGLVGQIRRVQEALGPKADVIGYAPRAGIHVYRNAERLGVRLFRNYGDLTAYVRARAGGAAQDVILPPVLPPSDDKPPPLPYPGQCTITDSC